MSDKPIRVRLLGLRDDVEKVIEEREMKLSEFVREAIKDHIYTDRLPRRDLLAWVLEAHIKIYKYHCSISNNLNYLVREWNEIKVMNGEALEKLLKESLEDYREMRKEFEEWGRRFWNI